MKNKVIKKIKGFINEIKEDSIDAYSAQATFFLMMSIIPFFILLLSLIKYTPVTESDFMSYVVEFLPKYVQPFFVSIINEVYSKSVGIVSFSVVFALWSAAKGFFALNKGLNKVYEVEETRNYIYLRLRACIITIILVVAVVLALLLLVFGNALQGKIEEFLPIFSVITRSILGLKVVILPLFFVVLFMLVYTFMPNRKMKIKHQLPGAVFCSAGWYLISFFFSVYVEFSTNFSMMYGSLSTIFLVMLWLYFCMFIFLVGAEINSYFEGYISRKMNEIISSNDKN